MNHEHYFYYFNISQPHSHANSFLQSILTPSNWEFQIFVGWNMAHNNNIGKNTQEYVGFMPRSRNNVDN